MEKVQEVYDFKFTFLLLWPGDFLSVKVLCQWKYSTSHSKLPAFLLNMLKNNDKFELQDYAFS